MCVVGKKAALTFSLLVCRQEQPCQFSFSNSKENIIVQKYIMTQFLHLACRWNQLIVFFCHLPVILFPYIWYYFGPAVSPSHLAPPRACVKVLPTEL